MLDSFRNPPAQYRLAPIWNWSVPPDKNEAELQLREMHAKGIGGFFIRVGSPPGESAEWTPHLEHVRTLSGQLGVRMYGCRDTNEGQRTDEDTIPEEGSRASQKRRGRPPPTISPTASTATNGKSRADVVRADVRQPVDVLSLGPRTYAELDTPESVLGVSLLECGYKLVSSAAHAASEAQVPAELVAPRGWATSLEELKHLVDWQASLGVNLFCPSAFEYTIAPRSAPSQFIQATYWPHYRILSDYAARLGCVLSQGSHSAQAAILCPVDEPGPQATSGRVHFSVELLCECLYLYCSALLRMHVDFDILGEDLIGGGFVSDQRLLLAGEGYELLILPPMQAVRYDTAVRIREFWEDGGKVVASPPLPCREAEGTRHREVKKMFEDMFGECRSNTDEPVPRDNVLLPAADAPADLIAGLTDGVSRLIKSEVSVRMGGEECGDITFLHRTTPREEVFFFSNNADGPREAQISIRCVGAPHMLNPETGNVTALPNCTQKGNRTILLHRFERHGSLLVMFNDEPALAVAQPLIEEGQEIPLSDEWEFVPRHGNSLTIHDWRLEMPIHGVSEQVCTASFEASFRPNDLMLVLEDCREEHAMLCVRVNGKPACEVAGRTPDGGFRCFNIAPLAVIGVNTVEIVSDMHCFPTETAKPRIVGAFSLDETGNVLCPPRDRIRTGSWTEQGYPFYSGAAVYAQTVTIPQFLRSQKVVIETERPADMVEFAVNSQSAGVRAWAPFQVDITRLVQPGENRIEITVTNSAANALLSDARPSGLLGATRIIVS